MIDDVKVPEQQEPGDPRIPGLVQRLAVIRKAYADLDREEYKVHSAIEDIAKEVYQKTGNTHPHAAVEIMFNVWDRDHYFAHIESDLTPYLPEKATPDAGF